MNLGGMVSTGKQSGLKVILRNSLKNAVMNGTKNCSELTQCTARLSDGEWLFSSSSARMIYRSCQTRAVWRREPPLPTVWKEVYPVGMGIDISAVVGLLGEYGERVCALFFWKAENFSREFREGQLVVCCSNTWSLSSRNGSGQYPVLSSFVHF